MSSFGGWRVALRLARREALRRKAQTALMLVLICLPVLAVSAAAVVWRTQDVSSAEGVDRRIGAAAAMVQTTGTAQLVQSPDPEEGRGLFGEDNVEGRVIDRDDLDVVLRTLGGQRPAVPLVRQAASFRTDRGVGDTEILAVDLASPLAAGLLEPVEGQYPPGPGEVVVNRAVADRGPGIGETLTVFRHGVDGERRRELRVVGIAESSSSRGYELVAGAPGDFWPATDEIGTWLVGGGPVTWEDVRALNEIGVLVTSRQVLTDPPHSSALDPVVRDAEQPVDETTLTVLALVVVMVLIEVVLLAGPAFAVRAKAQAHTLALVAATGGTPRQARRTVLASGVVIGVAGGLLGVALGIGVGRLAVPLAQRFDSTRFGPFEVPWPLLLVVAAFGVLSALLAAVVPAVAAGRQDVVAVLGGRRGEGRASTRSPIVGLVLLGLGIAGAVLGSGADASPALVAGSAVVSVIGMILLVPLAVALAARLAARLPLPLRFAARDAARHRTRTVPAVAAVGATVAGVVALGIAVASQGEADEQSYVPMLPAGHASAWLGDGQDPAEVEQVLRSRLPSAAIAPVTGVVAADDMDGGMELRFVSEGEELGTEHWGSLGTPYLVGTQVPDHLQLGAAERASAAAVLADGGVVLLTGSQTEPVPTSEVTAIAERWDEADGGTHEVGRITARAVTVVVDDRIAPAAALLAPRAAQRLGLATGTTAFVLAGVVSDDAEADISESLRTLGEGYLYVERGFEPDPALRIVQLVLAVLGGVLMLGGTLTATFLALSDARPDLATMAAVGARSRTRRAIAASYALVVGLVGALLGAPVGFIPGVAISRPLTRDWETGATVLDVPWLLVGAVVLGLPLLTAAAVGLCARSRLPLVARVE